MSGVCHDDWKVNGEPVYLNVLQEEVDEGWRLFWKKRGVTLKKQNPKKKWYSYDVFATMLSPQKMMQRAMARKAASKSS